MIYPSERLILMMALGAPLALGIAGARPDLWLLPVGWIAFCLALGGADALLAPGRRSLDATLHVPATLFVGETGHVLLRWAWTGRAAPAEAALMASARLSAPDCGRIAVPGATAGETHVRVTARRRGPAAAGPADLRWRGPLGLAWRQRRAGEPQPVSVLPDIRPVRQEAPRLLAMDAEVGQHVEPIRGDSLEFDALGPWRAGEDKRRIDWKTSARHVQLIAKETRVERDAAVMLAIDCGRLMAQPLAGVARLDRAITAALLTGYVALRSGDRVGLFGFDRTPRAHLPPTHGAHAFAQLQAATGGLDYAEAETNFTLGLSRLGQALTRPTLILLFTDFVDPIGAELMLRAAAPLLKRHRLLAVTFADEELGGHVARRPERPADVTRAVVAAGLLRERRIVLERLRRMGAEVVEAPWSRLGPAVARRYLELKRVRPL
ncbi:MAG: DUF58 domain-containing protein [Sphingomonadaceae bacterium]|nr:DUF58 domain-containing protein [Sphingomonadaceae bacterium]